MERLSAHKCPPHPPAWRRPSVDSDSCAVTSRAASATRKETVAVLGAGSFGSAIARVLAQAPATSKVNVWARRASVADEINRLRTNKQYIDADNVFPPKVTAFTSVGDAIRNASIVVIVVPSLYLQPLLDDIATNSADLLANDAVIVSLVKSIHYDGTNLTTVCHEISETLRLPTVALMGPNIFREMIRDEFAEATIGHLPADVEAAARVKEIFTTSTFRVSTCDDRVGVELCGGLKKRHLAGSWILRGARPRSQHESGRDSSRAEGDEQVLDNALWSTRRTPRDVLRRVMRRR